jgi:hypothetical protein
MGVVFAACPQEDTAGRKTKTGRFISMTEGGVLAGNSDNENKTPFIFHSSVNYVIFDRLSVGLGAGIEFLKETHLPVTANVLYQFDRHNAVSPFVRFQTGYLFALESKMKVYNHYYSYSSSYTDAYYPSSEGLDAEGGCY